MSSPQLQYPLQPPAPQKPSAFLLALKWAWCILLAIICLCAFVLGFMGDVSFFWIVAVLGLPTIWLERKWSVRAKAASTVIFFLVFLGFGVFSTSPRGRAAHAAETKQVAQREKQKTQQEKQDAVAKIAEDKLAAKQRAKQEAEDAQQQQQQQAEDSRKDKQRKADEDADKEKEAVAAQDSTDIKTDAYLTAQKVITERLKSPSSAQYPNYESGFVQRTGDNTYRVTAYVDSQNGFGAMLRSQWTVQIKRDGEDGWLATSYAIH